MILSKSPSDIELQLNKLKKESKKIGFVPTMGALHQGHLSLIEQCKLENDVTVCSIFVNPLQFNDLRDLEKYPRPIEHDIKLLAEADTDILFLPLPSHIYPPNYKTPDIELNNLDTILEGASRPGHFKGVAYVVTQLFDFIKPDTAYFGQKDFQQTMVIEQIVKQFDLPIKVVKCKIIREANGLAMSSRNIRLNEQKRLNAGFIFSALTELSKNVKQMAMEDALKIATQSIVKNEGATIEYLTIVDSQTMVPLQELDISKRPIVLAAINYYGVRLLDNLFL